MVFAALAFAPLGVALAHGQPVIAVAPAVAPAGGQITITGTEMEPGEAFAIGLEGMADSIPLGQVAVSSEGEEGGFTATFTIPADTPPGSYTVRAATEEGEAATADLTVTAPSEEASNGPAIMKEPSGEPHVIDRTKPIGQIVAVIVGIALSSAAGFVLVRSPG